MVFAHGIRQDVAYLKEINNNAEYLTLINYIILETDDIFDYKCLGSSEIKFKLNHVSRIKIKFSNLPSVSLFLLGVLV